MEQSSVCCFLSRTGIDHAIHRVRDVARISDVPKPVDNWHVPRPLAGRVIETFRQLAPIRDRIETWRCFTNDLEQFFAAEPGLVIDGVAVREFASETCFSRAGLIFTKTAAKSKLICGMRFANVNVYAGLPCLWNGRLFDERFW